MATQKVGKEREDLLCTAAISVREKLAHHLGEQGVLRVLGEQLDGAQAGRVVRWTCSIDIDRGERSLRDIATRFSDEPQVCPGVEMAGGELQGLPVGSLCLLQTPLAPDGLSEGVVEHRYLRIGFDRPAAVALGFGKIVMLEPTKRQQVERVGVVWCQSEGVAINRFGRLKGSRVVQADPFLQDREDIGATAFGGTHAF